MLLAWCALNGMAGEFHNDDLADDLTRLRMLRTAPVAVECPGLLNPAI
jgi:hypothetical protein